MQATTMQGATMQGAIDHPGMWRTTLAIAAAIAAWNIRRLWIVRPAVDRRVAALGALGILALVIGASLVLTEVTECGFAASAARCSGVEIGLVAATALAASAALIALWLRSDACRPPRVMSIPPMPPMRPTRRHRVVSG
jgi:hypothetical protein